MKNRYIKISFILNLVVVVLTIITLILAFSNIKFMNEQEATLLSNTKFFNYFTVQSNTFLAIVSLFFLIKEYKVIKGIKKEIPLKNYIFKMVATTAVCLTFLVVFLFLGFVVEGGILALLKNNNLFFHLIIPLTGIINFIFFEKTDKIKFKYTFYGLIPTILYEIYYMTNIIINLKNGEILPEYDWYSFLQNGILTAILVAPIMLLITYIISLIIWKINKRIS